jgi:high-affinity iron transporter
MFGVAVIVLRETFEAALLVGIVAAATRTVGRSREWIAGGLVAGLVGAAAIAALTGRIAGSFDGVGQELFNAAILGLAVLMLAWHAIWMSSHGRHLMHSAQALGRGLTEGRVELSAILVVVALAVLREGSESVLFVYGLMTGGQATAYGAALGTLVGLCGGAAIGALLYAGLVRIPIKHFFTVTNTLVLVLAAGMAGRMAYFLIQADLLPAWANPLWDSSRLLPMDSALGALMQALAGYDATPAAMQVVFYVSTLVAIMTGMQWARRAS